VHVQNPCNGAYTAFMDLPYSTCTSSLAIRVDGLESRNRRGRRRRRRRRGVFILHGKYLV